ncbi:multidrug transporter EmrE-like cation transporter [Oikeobacillus pervagus]|uniref:Multidrug transporter EmrE-like cation transporter n=1 Tax=Oikeobacillus pervagus TaxID=1325931 RepID=A0AAJ1T4W5_9BACI|nr:EamA family transporter [Oikeobacillus pervagus]MDQ0215256.1 multidrug transporter EmrE-like cation transporter [Oikeobacillus pervagus]
MKNILLILFSVFLSSMGQIVLKYGAVKTVDQPKSMEIMNFLSPINITGLFLYGLSALVWMVVLRKVELSYAYPMVSVGYVLVFVFSYYLFGESLSMNRIIGMVFIMIGIIFISRS